MKRASFTWGAGMALAFIARVAFAGDAGERPAHEHAELVVAKQVNAMFPRGIGSPMKAPPLATFTFGTGEGVAAPDSWACWSDDENVMPPDLSKANRDLATGLVGNSVNAFPSDLGLGMVCNWTHFASNPLFPGHDATATEIITRRWANYLVEDIPIAERRYFYESFCDQPTWAKFLYRHNAANHFLQDKQTVFHAQGNAKCDPRDWSHDFSQSINSTRCRNWIKSEFKATTVLGSKLSCDDEVLNRFGGWSGKMGLVNVGCNSILTVPLWGTQMAACAGLERTMRHHCNINYPYLACHGPGDDHRLNHFYCEGEEYPDATDNDFMAGAESVSLPPLLAAANAWGSTCQQPDAPCDASACQTWCERSTRLVPHKGDESLKQIELYRKGYREHGTCVPAPTDPKNVCAKRCACETLGPEAADAGLDASSDASDAGADAGDAALPPGCFQVSRAKPPPEPFCGHSSCTDYQAWLQTLACVPNSVRLGTTRVASGLSCGFYVDGPICSARPTPTGTYDFTYQPLQICNLYACPNSGGDRYQAHWDFPPNYTAPEDIVAACDGGSITYGPAAFAGSSSATYGNYNADYHKCIVAVSAGTGSELLSSSSLAREVVASVPDVLGCGCNAGTDVQSGGYKWSNKPLPDGMTTTIDTQNGGWGSTMFVDLSGCKQPADAGVIDAGNNPSDGGRDGAVVCN